MHASPEKPGLPPRANIVIATVDGETVRTIVRAERAFLAEAAWMGIDFEEAHLGYAPYIAKILEELSDEDRSNFEELLAEETLHYDKFDEAKAKAASAEQRYADYPDQPKTSSTLRILFIGISVTILIGLAFFLAND